MGVTELWSILEPVRQSVSLYSLSGKTLAVDLSLWVCEAQHVQGMMGRVTKPHLRNLFFRVSSLTLMGVKLVFVMEGEAPKIKAETMSKRTEMRFGGTKAKSIPKPVKNTNRGRFNAVLRECAQMLDCLGVPWVTAAGEAEAMCAFLDSQGLVDGCITNDGDAFLYGARTVYRNFNMTTKDPQVDCYQSSRVQEELGLCRETLVGLAVLLGCDYIPKGIAGVGREQTLKLIHSLRGQTLLQKFSEWSSGASGDSELQMKKVTHCLVCRHPGSAKAHERSGCVFCVSERFCSPQDYDSQCPCEWHQTQASRQASSLENNIRKRTLASEHFPFTHIINEFLLTKDKPVQAFRRRKPNLLLMQEFALEKMDWPKHYSSEKLLTLMTYTEMVNRRLGRDSHTHMQPIRIYKARVRNGVSCLEVIWKTPEHYVFAEGCEEQAEVRTVEEEALFSLAFPEILQEFQRERNQAQEKKTKKKKPKVKKETLADSHDAVSDLFSQMTLNTDPQVVSSTQNPPQPDLPPYPGIQVQTPPSGNSHSVSALIGQLHLSSIDWDSASFTASPSQNTHETDLRPAENDNCSLKERIITNKQQAKYSDGIADGKTDLRPAENNICSLKERIVAQKQRSKDSDGIADDKTDLRPALKERIITKKQQTKHSDALVDDKTDLRPVQHSLCSLKEQMIMKKQQTKHPGESITLRNFMSHHLLGPLKFGANVNFIVGNNGTGKSAILTALIVGLGGKATTTNRGTSLKGFVKYGETSTDIKVKLKNRGNDPYKGDVYGDSICIEHRITSDGCRTCKIKNKAGHVVSTKKEELTAILDHFGIQVDNPVSVLNQEMSKQFLHSKSEADKYRFFMKATLLEQMKRDYIHIKQTKAVTRDQVERQEECLRDLRQLFLQKKERYERMSSLDDMRQTLEDLKKKMAWSLVREKESQVEQLKEQIEKEDADCKHEEKLQLCQNKVAVAEKKLQDSQKHLCTLREEQEHLTEESRKMKEEIKVKTKAQKSQEVVYFRAENKLKQLKKEQCLLQERIHKISHGSRNRQEAEHMQHLKKISALKNQLEKLETESRALNQEIKDRQQALHKGREEYDKLSMEEKNIKASLESKSKRKKQLMASRSNRLRRFGDHMPELMESINKAFAQGRFKKKPVGPIGACISLKDPTLTLAVECCLGFFLKSFCCDNYKDEKVLQGLMSQYFYKGNRPQIMVCPFTDHVYNLQGRGVHHPEFPSVLDCLNIENPVIANCLIDMRSIESILVIREKARARKVMQGSRPPKNCREAFTADGDQVFTNRYYTPEHEVLVKYLGGDPEAEISLVNGELENIQAQLLRFQLHSGSVKEDIQLMEEKLRSVIMACKKNQESINKVKASITELENIEEAQDEDISSLEEEAQENEQKIELEKRIVKEAEDELRKHEKGLLAVNQKFKDVKCKMEKLSDEMEQLKEEQVKAETVCNKLDQTMKTLEKKLKDHQNNIQSMKEDLSLQEEDLRDCEAKARELCPERQQVDQSPRSIDVEITRLRQKIKTQENSHGDKEQIIREYAEAHSNYKSKSSQLRDLRKFIDRLDNIMIDRQDRYKTLRKSLSVRCKLYFNNFMIQLHCCGSMMFDHNNETLSISVKPPGQEMNSVSDMRSLSGGERSFSTVCFILALWEITESPFRCLDEFDVYMDMHNRSISMNMLVALSERQHLRQFIFITPQSISQLPKSTNITIHQLQDPEKDTEEE